MISNNASTNQNTSQVEQTVINMLTEDTLLYDFSSTQANNEMNTSKMSAEQKGLMIDCQIHKA